MARRTILIVEDDKNVREGLGKVLAGDGYEVLLARDGIEGWRKLRDSHVDLVVTDLVIPRRDGMEILRLSREKDPDLPVLLITAFGTIERAVEAIRMGAEDFLTKPVNVEGLKVKIAKALERRELLVENLQLRQMLRSHEGLQNIIGRSPKVREIFKVVRQIAPSRSTILIQGESGTGKELIATAIHYHSPRAAKPLIKVSCSALSEGVLESELFGHEKGAFTGAVSQRKGRFELADGGTLFLDEIGEISERIQLKLLRILQEREFERVGGSRTLRVDVRLIAATNRDLEAAIREGAFRDDLYYRLNVVSLKIPPLRERREDIPFLVDHFLRKYGRENRKPLKGITPRALNLLMQHEWKGNVRELENAIESAVVLARGPYLLPENLPPSLLRRPSRDREIRLPVGASLREVEREAIFRTLERTKGNKAQAAKILGIGLRTIYAKIRAYRVGG